MSFISKTVRDRAILAKCWPHLVRKTTPLMLNNCVEFSLFILNHEKC